MRNGYILLHRQGITPDEWKNPRRTLAWIDLLTLVDHETSIVTVSYGFLATRWRVSKDTSFQWVKHWITERQLERQPERSSERNAERFFCVNYAKYQKTAERFTERDSERRTERKAEQRYTVSSTPSKEHHRSIVPSADDTSDNRKICSDLYDGMLSANEAEKTADEKNPKRREQKVSAWVKSVGQLKRIDGATDQQITFVIKWLFSSGKKNAIFWQKNIRSGATLREKWSQLVANCKEDYARKEHGSLTIPSNDEIRQMESQGIQFL
jgi:hypothetical protein